MGGFGVYTITKDFDGGVSIEWPQGLQGDDAVVAFIQDLRKFGIGTTSKMDNTTGQLKIAAGQQLGIYQKALMYEPVDYKFIVSEEDLLKPVEIKPPVSVWWTLQMVETVQMAKPGIAAWPYYESHYSQQPAPAEQTVVAQKTYVDLAEELSKYIPDIRKSVKGPCKCVKYRTGQIWYLIQHLNDHHHPDRKLNGRRLKDIWTRERIADWLDEVDADLAFDPDLPAKREAQRAAARAERQRQREALIKDGIVTGSQMDWIKTELGELPAKTDVLKQSMVKLNVAIDEFSKSMHESMKAVLKTVGPVPGCTCAECKAKSDLYPEKFPDQEES